MADTQDITATKRCSKCSGHFPVGLFYRSGSAPDGSPRYHSWCGACARAKRHEKRAERAASTARWRLANPGKTRELHDKWIRENPERIKTYQRQTLLKKYGLSVAQFDAMFTAQCGKCAICRADFGPDRPTMPYVDHCHATGKTRELLCIRCNSMIGHGRDDTTILLSAVDYLRRHKEVA